MAGTTNSTKTTRKAGAVPTYRLGERADGALTLVQFGAIVNDWHAEDDALDAAEGAATFAKARHAYALVTRTVRGEDGSPLTLDAIGARLTRTVDGREVAVSKANISQMSKAFERLVVGGFSPSILWSKAPSADAVRAYRLADRQRKVGALVKAPGDTAPSKRADVLDALAATVSEATGDAAKMDALATVGALVKNSVPAKSRGAGKETAAEKSAPAPAPAPDAPTVDALPDAPADDAPDGSALVNALRFALEYDGPVSEDNAAEVAALLASLAERYAPVPA